jgi:hypothetical protein
MNKRIFALVVCLSVLLLCACNTRKTYKRISFNGEALGEQLSGIKDDTVVTFNSENTFDLNMPIYEIKKRNISEEECQEMIVNLGLEEKSFVEYKLEENYLHINLAWRTNFDRGYFDMTEEEAVELAWEIFNKIPFMEGEYECIGIRQKYTLRDNEGSHTTRAGVVFCRLLDGVRVTGNEKCTLYFDGSGLVQISLWMYEYEEIGSMKMVSMEDAIEKLRSPDDLELLGVGESLSSAIKEMQYDQVKLRLVNQYTRGCTILQPIYYFEGAGTLEDERQFSCSAKVIAIPEEMTYEE